MTNPDTSEKLEPCPFCGGEAEMDTQRGYRALASGRIGSAVAIYCLSCDVEMMWCREDVRELSTEDIVAELVRLWNTRPSPPFREALEKLLREAIPWLRGYGYMRREGCETPEDFKEARKPIELADRIVAALSQQALRSDGWVTVSEQNKLPDDLKWGDLVVIGEGRLAWQGEVTLAPTTTGAIPKGIWLNGYHFPRCLVTAYRRTKGEG